MMAWQCDLYSKSKKIVSYSIVFEKSFQIRYQSSNKRIYLASKEFLMGKNTKSTDRECMG
jgi:hypothetical protein